MHKLNAVILAGGETSRWNNYLDKPKHLLNIGGEPLLGRAVRLLRAGGVTDITVLVADVSDERYRFPGANLAATVPNRAGVGVDKLAATTRFWGPQTLILYGDVYYSDKAMATMLTDRHAFQMFGRFTPSEFTGKPWGEIFGFRIVQAAQPAFRRAITKAAELQMAGKLRRCGGWQAYRVMAGGDPNRHRDYGLATVVDDLTDDFDYPHDLNNWVEAQR